MHPTLNDHEYYMRPACVVHAVWRHFILVPSTPFSQVLWSVLWLRHQFVTDVTVWQTNPNPSCSKNRKIKQKKTKIKFKKKRKEKEKIKTKSTVNDLDKHLAKNCRSRQKIKNRSIQEESDKEDSNKEESFIKGLE